jgi:hypothetical protein
MVYSSEEAWGRMPEAERQKIFEAFMAYSRDVRKNGHWVNSHALQPTSAATTIRIREGKTLITDGPFAETREQLAGYFLVEAKDLDEAIALGARIPGALYGSIEVRPIMPTPPVD